MNYRQLLILGSAVTALGFAAGAHAQMSYGMVQRDLWMNYAGTVEKQQAAIAMQAGKGMNYAGAIDSAARAVALVPMDVAVKAAENEVPGRAFSAELERTKGNPVYVVEFAGKAANTDVWVDAKSGKVEKIETIDLASGAPGA